MLSRCRHLLRDTLNRVVLFFERRARNATRPCRSFLLGAIADRFRSPAELAAENQLLRQQLLVVCRQIAKPQLRPKDRVTLRNHQGSANELIIRSRITAAVTGPIACRERPGVLLRHYYREAA